jgi:hypothetical protein
MKSDPRQMRIPAEQIDPLIRPRCWADAGVSRCIGDKVASRARFLSKLGGQLFPDSLPRISRLRGA